MGRRSEMSLNPINVDENLRYTSFFRIQAEEMHAELLTDPRLCLSQQSSDSVRFLEEDK